MTLTIPADVRAKAEIYVGDAAGQEKTRLLLRETGLPSGLLPLKDIVECGYVEETGFVWLRQRRRVDHYFAGAGRHVSYGAEVSAVAEKGRLKRITGVKAKEMLLWVTLHEICVDDPPRGKLHCKAVGGLSRSFPVEAFEADDAAANGNGAAAAVVADEEAAAAEKEGGAAVEAKKGEEEAKKGETAAPSAAEEETNKDKNKEEEDAAVGKVEEKLKELSTELPHKHAETLAANN